MKRLDGASELLDGPLDRDALCGNLRDLERVNRRGGAGLSWHALRRLLPQAGSVRLLDVGTGGADIPRALLQAARDSQLQLEVTATDVRAPIVELVRERSAGVDGLTIELATPDKLDFADGSFDVVHASLVLHHLEPAAAVKLLGEMRRVTRAGVIVNDLDRGYRWWAGAWLLGHLLTRNSYTRNDAPLSVRRAYTANELSALAAAAGLREVQRLWTRPRYRYALVLTTR